MQGQKGFAVTTTHDISVDFMDMTEGRHLWARTTDARPGTRLVVGGHVVVGDGGADPSVGRILTIDADGLIELEVLPGTVESHRDLRASAS